MSNFTFTEFNFDPSIFLCYIGKAHVTKIQCEKKPQTKLKQQQKK